MPSKRTHTPSFFPNPIHRHIYSKQVVKHDIQVNNSNFNNRGKEHVIQIIPQRDFILPTTRIGHRTIQNSPFCCFVAELTSDTYQWLYPTQRQLQGLKRDSEKKKDISLESNLIIPKSYILLNVPSGPNLISPIKPSQRVRIRPFHSRVYATTAITRLKLQLGSTSHQSIHNTLSSL